MQTRNSRVSIKLSLRDRNEQGLYTVAIRYYEPGIEKYIPTAYRTTKSEWKASRGEFYHNVQVVKDQLAKEITSALELCGDELTYDRFKSSLKGERLSSTMSLVTLIEKHLLDQSKRSLWDRICVSKT